MLHMGYLTIENGQNTKTISFENFHFCAAESGKQHEQAVPQLPWTPKKHPNRVKNMHTKRVKNMLHIGYFIIVDGRSEHQKSFFETFIFLSCRGWKTA